MKKLTILNSLILLLMLGAGWTYTLDMDRPLGSESPSVLDDNIRLTRDGFQERLNVEHNFELTGTELSGANVGKHTDITCDSIVCAGAVSGTTWTGSGDVAINTDKFTVAAATGNTAVAGTLGVTGVATLGDSSQMATSAAPTADADLANKKYVDEVVQLVNVTDGALNTGSTFIPKDDTIPQITEGDEYMTLAITPKAATNKLKIDVVFNGSMTASGRLLVALFQDSTANALAVGGNYVPTDMTNGIRPVVFTHYMLAGTTSATTFKVRAGGQAGAVTFNGESAARILGGILSSSITITEIRD
jgi:hypothetical protein